MEQKMYGNTYKSISNKNKIINHIMKDGGKRTAEKLLLKSYKEIHKTNSKITKNLFKLALLNTIITFKINNTKRKRKRKKKIIIETPKFLRFNKARLSLAIKLLLKTINKKINFFLTFSNEILLTTRNEGQAIGKKLNSQQRIVFLSTKYKKFYRW